MNIKFLLTHLFIERYQRKYFFRIVNITFLFLFSSVFYLRAEKMNPQDVFITVRENNVSIENVFCEI